MNRSFADKKRKEYLTANFLENCQTKYSGSPGENRKFRTLRKIGLICAFYRQTGGKNEKEIAALKGD